MSAPDVLVLARVVLEPVVDLVTGAVVAVAAHGPPHASTEHAARVDPATRDIAQAVEAAHAAGAAGVRVPLQLRVRTATLALGGPALDELHTGLVRAGRRPRDVILCAGGPFAPAQRPGVSAALRGLRRAGYLVGLSGLGSAHLPLDLLVDGVASPLQLDPDLARAAGGDPGRTALVQSLVDLARRVGTQVHAPGLDGVAQVERMRALGVRLARGPVLAPPHWRPGDPVTVPLAAPAPKAPAAGPAPERLLGPRVTEYTVPAVTLPDSATAAEVLEVLNAETSITSVVLLDARQRPAAAVDRTRFLLRLSGAYGHALHAHKPAVRLADAPRTVPRTVPAIAALRAAGGDGGRVHDDLVVVDEVGRCLGVARVADLIRGLPV